MIFGSGSLIQFVWMGVVVPVLVLVLVVVGDAIVAVDAVDAVDVEIGFFSDAPVEEDMDPTLKSHSSS